MTLDQLRQLATSAGFTGENVKIAAAVAMAESGGDPNAYNTEGSYGLWQIDIVYHPQYQADPNALFTPSTNAQAAYETWLAAGRSFNPWTTYRCPCNITPCVGTPCYRQWYTPPAPLSDKLVARDWALIGAASLAAVGIAALVVHEVTRPGALLPWRA